MSALELKVTCLQLPHGGRGHQSVTVPAGGGRASFTPHPDTETLEVEIVPVTPIEGRRRLIVHEEIQRLADVIEKQGGYIRSSTGEGEHIVVNGTVVARDDLIALLFELNGRQARLLHA